jgi:ligand-binding sensor domain-containing protein/DNA-binding CsgD family transcriptional regulator
VPNNQYFLRKFILIFLISFSVKAQLLPPIQSYTPEQYNGANQNWMIDGSSDNKILFSNSEGLLVYDGTTWVKYNSPNGSLIRSVKFIDDLIYTGAHSDFGYWEKLSNGTLFYTSLIKKLNLNLEEDEEFWKILTLDNWIIFQSLHRFIFLDKNSSDVKYLKIDDTIITSFVIDNQIYFSLQSGFYKLINGQPVQIINNKIPSPIVNAFKTNDGLLFLTENDGFYIEKNPGNLSKINSYLDLNNNFSIFSSLQLNDNSFVLGTVGQGLIFLDSNLKYVNKIDKSNGLINNTVLSLFQDFENNIWLGLDNGISVININSPFKIYSDDNGVLGTVYASKVYNNFLYIGTNQGLYYKKYNSNEAFKLMSNTSGQVWSLEEIDGMLFCGHDKGTFIIKNSIAQKIDGTIGSWTFKKIPNNSSEILEGSYNGLSVLSNVNGSWVVKNKISGFDISSRFFELASNGKIIVSHGYKGVYKLSVNSDFSKVIDYELDSIATTGGNTSLAKFDNKIYYNFIDGVLQYNSLTNTFSKDTLLSNLSSKYLFYGIIRNDNDGKLWLFSESKLHYVYKDLVTGNKKVNSLVYPFDLRRTVFENISKTDESNYILGTNNGYISLDIDNYSIKSPEIRLNKIEAFKLNQDPELLNNEGFNQLEYNSNNLRFYPSVSNYQKFQPVTFEYFLEGYLNEWISIDETSVITFNNLKPGDYEFKLRAKIGDLYSKNTESFSFSVERPWYLSNFMIANYLLIFAILFFLLNRSYEKYYREKEEKMIRINKNKMELIEFERKQALMAVENTKLQTDIESKNRELAVSTMSMIKKNQFLSKIKSDLKKPDSSDKIFSVIKMIDRNLNNKDDWKFFEEAFNNADKDFLKKVKSTHPSLTNNDLRLCAYLRLNLSSKDIAPLLNISLSSVEIKRYRLRKKMNLSHGEGLTEHLLSL